MSAIFKREFKAYFATPIGYIILAAFYFFLGLYFTIIYNYGAPQVPSVIVLMSTIAVFVTPVLTMRLMSEDRRQKVDQALLTAPVSLTSIVMGKFLAALAVFALGFAPTIIFEIIVASYVSVNFGAYLYALIGILLLGGTLISIGMFISSLTESTVVSGILTLVVNILVLFISSIKSLITVPSSETFIGKIWAKIVEFIVLALEKADFISAFDSFGNNILSVADVVYFVSLIAVFVFLSVRSLEKRRWA